VYLYNVRLTSSSTGRFK